MWFKQGTFSPAVLALLKQHGNVEYISVNSRDVDDDDDPDIVDQKFVMPSAFKMPTTYNELQRLDVDH